MIDSILCDVALAPRQCDDLRERERRRRLDCQFLKVHLDHLESGVGLNAGQGRRQGEGRLACHTKDSLYGDELADKKKF